MYRTFVVVLAAVFVNSLGCGRKDSAAVPAHEPAGTPAIEMPPAQPAKVAVPQAAPAESATTAAPAASSRVRDLVSDYLVSDGKGGWQKNEKAATELEKLTAEETAQLWPLLKDQQVNVRRGAAVFLLSLFDPAYSDQVEAFSTLLGDPDAMVRARGLDAAKQFATSDQILVLKQLGALLDAKREERPENRAAAARLCGSLKRDGMPALAALKQAAVDDPDSKVRSAALAAIAQVAEPTDAANTLAGGLGDKDASVRLVAAARLRQLGPASALAAQPLAAALADSSQEVTEAAAEALIRIGPAAVSALAEQLGSTNVSTRKLALACLVKIGPAAKPAAERIEKCKKDADAEVRQLAELALARILAK